jgi:hypothetical protein
VSSRHAWGYATRVARLFAPLGVTKRERVGLDAGLAERRRLNASLLVMAWLLAFLSISGCSAQRHQEAPFSTPFGVGVGDVPITAPQLDAIGPVWYLDWNWRGPALKGHERLYIIGCAEVKGDRGAIPAAMRASGASWWALGNEPNDPHQDNRTPEEYAELYFIFEGWAKNAPHCRILPAGIANADWQWAEAFREAFRAKYGRYPRVDGWNIHNYILEPGLDPYDIGEFQRRILAFHRWMERIGDGHKPLFLTEFGVLYGNGCCGRPVDPPEKVQAFMRDAVQWLVESKVVACWAWFATYSEQYNGSLMTTEGQLNDLGILYRDLVQKHVK